MRIGFTSRLDRFQDLTIRKHARTQYRPPFTVYHVSHLYNSYIGTPLLRRVQPLALAKNRPSSQDLLFVISAGSLENDYRVCEGSLFLSYHEGKRAVPKSWSSSFCHPHVEITCKLSLRQDRSKINETSASPVVVLFLQNVCTWHAWEIILLLVSKAMQTLFRFTLNVLGGLQYIFTIHAAWPCLYSIMVLSRQSASSKCESSRSRSRSHSQALDAQSNIFWMLLIALYLPNTLFCEFDTGFLRYHRIGVCYFWLLVWEIGSPLDSIFSEINTSFDSCTIPIWLAWFLWYLPRFLGLTSTVCITFVAFHLRMASLQRELRISYIRSLRNFDSQQAADQEYGIYPVH